MELFDTYKSTNFKRLGCEVNHPPPSSAKVKKVWSCTSALRVCLHGVDREGNENTNCGHDITFCAAVIICNIISSMLIEGFIITKQVIAQNDVQNSFFTYNLHVQGKVNISD